MPDQFDVFLNPLKDNAAYPLIVVLQSSFTELVNTRIVAPAIHAKSGDRTGGVLRPQFLIDGQKYILQTFQLTSMKVTSLKRKVGNIADVRDDITRALDHLFHDNA